VGPSTWAEKQGPLAACNCLQQAWNQEYIGTDDIVEEGFWAWFAALMTDTCAGSSCEAAQPSEAPREEEDLHQQQDLHPAGHTDPLRIVA